MTVGQLLTNLRFLSGGQYEDVCGVDVGVGGLGRLRKHGGFRA